MHIYILIVRPLSYKSKSGRDHSASDVRAMGPRFESQIILTFFFNSHTFPKLGYLRFIHHHA